MEGIFIPAISPPRAVEEPAAWFLFQGFRLLVFREGSAVSIPLLASPEEAGLLPIRRQYLGRLNGDSRAVDCFCGEIAEGEEPPPGFAFENLRPLYLSLDETAFWLAGRAVQIVDWDRTHQYCGRCGHPTADHATDRAKVCPNCGLTQYPRLAPAVIVRVQRQTAGGSEILLARANRFPTAMFSVLAGFVEPGETLEECVQREIQEEVGIRVKDINYFGSQPWPFPHSLMIAFTAEHESGELKVDMLELAEADWYAPERMPAVPPPPSIANQLITAWLADVARD